MASDKPRRHCLKRDRRVVRTALTNSRPEKKRKQSGSRKAAKVATKNNKTAGLEKTPIQCEGSFYFCGIKSIMIIDQFHQFLPGKKDPAFDGAYGQVHGLCDFVVFKPFKKH